MTIHANSRKAHKELTGTQEATIANYLALGPLTRRQISQYIGLETSTVSGRVNSLIAKGRVAEVGSTVCETTGKTVAIVALTKDLSLEQRDQIAARLVAKVGAA